LLGARCIRQSLPTCSIWTTNTCMMSDQIVLPQFSWYIRFLQLVFCLLHLAMILSHDCFVYLLHYMCYTIPQNAIECTFEPIGWIDYKTVTKGRVVRDEERGSEKYCLASAKTQDPGKQDHRPSLPLPPNQRLCPMYGPPAPNVFREALGIPALLHRSRGG
jgi:hypothetical protein